jgi:nitrogen fixation protein NifQ
MFASAYLELIDPRLLAGMPRTREDEYEDVLALLVENATVQGAPTMRLAEILALACLGENHLWQDLGLPSRQVLSDLMRENFPRLFLANVGNMRWKKFFYRELCRRAEIVICRSPSCAACIEIDVCFGAEEGPVASTTALAHEHLST